MSYSSVYHQWLLSGENEAEYLTLDEELNNVKLQSEKENKENLVDWGDILSDEELIKAFDAEQAEWEKYQKELEDELDELQEKADAAEENYRKNKRYNRAKRKNLK